MLPSIVCPRCGTLLVVSGETAPGKKVTCLSCHHDFLVQSVAAQLEKDGIASSEIEIVAKGKRDLLVPTKDGVKEPQNRRVQIVYDNRAGS